MIVSDIQVANNLIEKLYFGKESTTTNYCCNIRHAIKVLESIKNTTVKIKSQYYLMTCIIDGTRVSISEKDFPLAICKLALKIHGYFLTL